MPLAGVKKVEMCSRLRIEMMLRWFGLLFCSVLLFWQCATPLPPLDGFPCSQDSSCGGTLKCLNGFCQDPTKEVLVETPQTEGTQPEQESSMEKATGPEAPTETKSEVSPTEAIVDTDASEPPTEAPPEESCIDDDKDGYCKNIPGDKGKLDCNDNDKTMFPGNPEVCDNKDNDCDGTVDGQSQSCSTLCGQGTQTCSKGTWSLCATTPPTQAEACDGKDNDCDGEIDEGISGCVTEFASATTLENRNIRDLTTDAKGDLYLLDRRKHQILHLDSQGKLNVVAGAGAVGFQDGPAATALFNSPQSLAFGPQGRLFVADRGNNRIRVIDLAKKEVSTYAGTGLAGTEDGPAVYASFGSIIHHTVDVHGNVYVLQSDTHQIRVITPERQVITLAGSGTAGSQDGTGLIAQFNNPIDFTLDWYGNLYVADHGSHTIRKLDPTGKVTTVAGQAGTAGSKDSTNPLSATFEKPTGMALDSHGRLILVDLTKRLLRQIDFTQGVTTFAGGGSSGQPTGPAQQVQFDTITRTHISPQGYLYILDVGTKTIYRMDLRSAPTAQACSTKGETRACYTGPSSTKGKGLCKDGVQTCGADLFWSRCTGQTLPSTEICDGNDNTCNGTADNTPTVPFCRKQLGACVGAGRQSCSAKALKPCPDSQYTALNNGYKNDVLDACDGKDNNCNGVIDENDQNCVTTVAGFGRTGFVQGPRSKAAAAEPVGILVDNQGNLVVSMYLPSRILWFDPYGNLLRSIGGSQNGLVDGKDPALVQFSSPAGMDIDSQGNIYVAERDNHAIRKILPTGEVQTVAGTGSSGFTNGPANKATFNAPRDIVVDSKGNLFVADANNNVIRRIDTQGNVTTFAGSPTGQPGNQDGTRTEALFKQPISLALDRADNIVVVDKDNGQLRKITPAGKVTTLNLTPQGSATFRAPLGIVADLDGTFYIVNNSGHGVLKLEPNGTLSEFAGHNGAGFQDGQASQSRFTGPIAISLDTSRGYLYVTDTKNNRVRRVNLRKLEACTGTGTRKCYIGPANTGTRAPCKEGTQTCSASGYWGSCLGQTFPTGETCNSVDDDCDGKTDNGADMLGPLCTKQAGICQGSRSEQCTNGQWQTCNTSDYQKHNAKYLDTDNKCDKFDADCNGRNDDAATSCVTTWAGTGSFALTNGTWEKASFARPQDIVIDSKNNIFVSDTSNSVIRKIDPQGNVTTFAGGTPGFADGTGANAKFKNPEGLAINQFDFIFVADTGNNTIRRISPTGVVTTIAGQTQPGHTNAKGALAQFNIPRDVAFDSKGNLFVTDSNNNKIRKIDMFGNVTDFAGSTAGHQDGTGIVAQFVGVNRLVIDSKDNIYLAEMDPGGSSRGHYIRKITPTGMVSTLAGTGVSGHKDGAGKLAQFSTASGLALRGNLLYIADRNNGSIRILDLQSPMLNVTTFVGDHNQKTLTNGPTSQARFHSPTGITFDKNGHLFVVDTFQNNIRRIVP
ncbi:MAG: hypothetical protein EP343_24940 [Deltaproteobacteria bacterium]|nr:MAG: hypothetical protein EP343_24940 [Deltaproteobacteria bacterium]